MKLLLALPALLLLAVSAGARDGLLSAPAQAPAAAADAKAPTKSDLTFILTGDEARFPDDTTLVIKDPSTVSAIAGERVSIMSTAAFADATPTSPLLSADGKWLDAPQAILYGMNSTGGLEAVALNLDGVSWDNETEHLTFSVSTLQPIKTSIKLASGPVTAAVTDSEQGTGVRLATALTAGQEWETVTLVIQSQRTALHQPAESKTWGWGGYGRGYGGGCYGCGWNSGWGGRGYYQPWWWGR